MGNHDNLRIASRYPNRSDQTTMLSMVLAVTYKGEEIGMMDKRDISWEDTQNPQESVLRVKRNLRIRPVILNVRHSNGTR